MRPLREGYRVARHFWRLHRGGQVRFRLETFGLYYPALPYARRWWQVNLRTLFLLARQLSSYAAWIIELERLQERGSGSYWDNRLRYTGEPEHE